MESVAHLIHCSVLGVWLRRVADSSKDPDVFPLGKADMPKQSR